MFPLIATSTESVAVDATGFICAVDETTGVEREERRVVFPSIYFYAHVEVLHKKTHMGKGTFEIISNPVDENTTLCFFCLCYLNFIFCNILKVCSKFI